MALKPAGKQTNPSAGKPKKGKSPEASSKVELRVKIARADITQIAVPVVVVGHYKGVAPIRAVGALDAAMSNWITQAGEHGMIGGNLGELFFIPVTQKQITAGSILLGGMG